LLRLKDIKRLEREVEKNSKNGANKTPLHLAIKHRQHAILNILLEAKINLFLKDTNRDARIFVVIRQGNTKALIALIQKNVIKTLDGYKL